MLVLSQIHDNVKCFIKLFVSGSHLFFLKLHFFTVFYTYSFIYFAFVYEFVYVFLYLSCSLFYFFIWVSYSFLFCFCFFWVAVFVELLIAYDDRANLWFVFEIELGKNLMTAWIWQTVFNFTWKRYLSNSITLKSRSINVSLISCVRLFNFHFISSTHDNVI